MAKIYTVKEATDELEKRFLNGAKLTKEEMINDYFPSSNHGAYLQAKGYTNLIVSRLKKRMSNKYDLWFGCLDSSGQFGVATTLNEVAYAIQRYFNNMKGNYIRVQYLLTYAKSRNLIPMNITVEQLAVPKLQLEDGKK